MASEENKYPENTPGNFFVDSQCIDCDACRQTAPHHFSRNDNEGHSFVSKQPKTEDEIKLCEEAQEGCPVDAIGQSTISLSNLR